MYADFQIQRSFGRKEPKAAFSIFNLLGTLLRVEAVEFPLLQWDTGHMSTPSKPNGKGDPLFNQMLGVIR